MLAIAKRVLGQGYSFATVRSRARKQSATNRDEEAHEKDVFKSYRKQVEKSSILRQFREDVFRRSELAGDWDPSKKMAEDDRKLRKMLKVDREEMLQKVSSIEARATQNRSIFDENTGRSLLSDYGNYKAYDKVYPVIDDRNLGEGEFLEDSQLTANLYKFIDKLPDDYQQKHEVQSAISLLPVKDQGMTIAEYGMKLQKQLNDAQIRKNRIYQNHKIQSGPRYAENEMTAEEQEIEEDWYEAQEDETYDYTGIPKSRDPWNDGQGLEATLSPQAVDTIYELYLQGWTVRDISKRFGILPTRTKFCVWVRAQLYHEIIPKLGVKYYLRALRFQERWNQEKAFCDYGLDMEQLTNAGILEEITEWNGKMLDAQRKEDQYLGAMKKLQRENKFSKYEMVEVGTLGSQNAKYRLKEWKVFRGKGSDLYFLRGKLLRELTRAQHKFNKQYY